MFDNAPLGRAASRRARLVRRARVRRSGPRAVECAVHGVVTMPSSISHLLIRAMFSFLFAAAVVGALVLGVIGLRAGDHGQLERILAIFCVFLAAASYLGVRGDQRKDEKPPFLTLGDKLMVLVSAPLLLLCTGVFIATLLPSWYVIVPTFAVLWRPIFGRAPRGIAAPPPEAHGREPQPAYG